MTDEQALAHGRKILELTGDDPLEADDSILISLGRIAVKLSEPYVLAEVVAWLREWREEEISRGDCTAETTMTLQGAADAIEQGEHKGARLSELSRKMGEEGS